jgi:hypothetical protein
MWQSDSRKRRVYIYWQARKSRQAMVEEISPVFDE